MKSRKQRNDLLTIIYPQRRCWCDMVFPVKLFKNNNKPYRLLAAEDNGEVIWAETVNDKANMAGNRMPKKEFNRMLVNERWESDVITVFTYADGNFQPIEHEHKTTL